MSTVYDHEPTPQERGDYWVVVRTWILDSGLTPRAKLVYVALMSFADRAGHAWPSIQEISRRASLSKRTVYRALAELEEAGIIRRIHRTAQCGGNLPTEYRISVQGGEFR